VVSKDEDDGSGAYVGSGRKRSRGSGELPQQAQHAQHAQQAQQAQTQHPHVRRRREEEAGGAEGHGPFLERELQVVITMAMGLAKLYIHTVYIQCTFDIHTVYIRYFWLGNYQIYGV